MLLLATRPPKRRVRPSVCRTASFVIGVLPHRLAYHARDELAQSARQEEDQQNDREAEEQLPMHGQRFEDLLEQRKHERATDRAVERAGAAENDHQENVPRLMPGEDLRI